MTDSRGVYAWLSRPVVGVLVIAALVLLLGIPIGFIRDLIIERMAARGEALEDVTSTWGGAQSVLGPRLVVPYSRPASENGADRETGYVNLLPAALTIEGRLTAEALSRGLFTVPVYDARLRLTGRFEPVDRETLGIAEDDLLWDQAALVFEVSEPRTVGAASSASWNGRAVELRPGATGASHGRPGIHAPVPPIADGGADFDVSLDVRGSEGLRLVPFSRSTRVRLASDWPHPSFSGTWLPGEREVQAAGFSADWEIPFLGRDYPQAWLSRHDPHQQVLDSRFGVELVSPVDHYRMSERSTKYAPLFLALTFGFLWLFDTLVGVRVHPMQYLMVGAAMCVFYLLELSLSEHVGFAAAYAIAAFGVVALVTGYARAVLGSIGRGALMAGATGVLYAYLFALLTLERYALLVGSLGVFLALATVMHLTRWVDWHALTRADEAKAA